MDIVDCIMGIMYIVVLGCVLYYINKFQMDKLKRDSKPINKVHFYVARQKDGKLYLFFGKPIRADNIFMVLTTPYTCCLGDKFEKYGLNSSDYDNLKWEDEPVEVFLNLED